MSVRMLRRRRQRQRRGGAAAIHLHWVADSNAERLLVYSPRRRARGVGARSDLSGEATCFADADVLTRTAFEFQVSMASRPGMLGMVMSARHRCAADRKG